MPTEQQLAEASFWLDRYIATVESVKERAAQAAAVAWEALEPSWYDVIASMALASEMAQMSTAGQDIIAGAAQQFVGNVVALMRGTRVEIPRVSLPAPRREADPKLVQYRPAEAYRRAVATGKTHEEALRAAIGRAEAVQLADLSLRERDAQQETMKALGIARFRRIVRPELSETGSCGLCIAASDRVYYVAELMPIHPPSCKCKTMPIVGDEDLGISLNAVDLKQLYADAGSNKGEDLRRTRYKVAQHGEYGPTLVKQGDSFRGPDSVALEDDPARAGRMLAKTLPVLAGLEQRAASGEDVAEPLDYQRNLVDRLRRIVGD